MLYFNHKKCTRYFKSFILNLFEIEILNDESLYSMYRVFSCHFSGKISQKKDGTQLVPGLSTVFLFLTAVRHTGPNHRSVSYTFFTFLRISQKSNVAK